MSLENIVFCLTVPPEIEVLYPDGNNFSRFTLEKVPEQVHQTGDSIIVNFHDEIVSYDYLGNIKWQSSEPMQPTSNESFLTLAPSGIYVLNSRTKKKDAKEEWDYTIEKIMGKDCVLFRPHFKELMLSLVDYDGNLKFTKMVHDSGCELAPALLGRKRLVVPYKDDTGNGFKVVDLEGRVLETQERNLFFRDLVVEGNIFAFKNEDLEAQPYQGESWALHPPLRHLYIELYNIDKQRTELQVPVSDDVLYTPPKGYGGSNNRQRIFFRTSKDIKMIDLAKKEHHSYALRNNGLYLLEDSLVVSSGEDDFNQRGKVTEVPNVVSGYDFGMNLLWKFNIPGNCKPHNIFPVSDGVLLATDENLVKVKDGQVEWTNYLNRMPSGTASKA